jgi:O-phosphoseryl-tRNA(Cys) synthetase
MLAVKTYYVSGTQLKHVMYTKQSYSFTKQSLTWSSVTTISLYNSAARATISLTISSVEWGPGLSSIIFYTNNPLNLSADALAMPFARLLLTQ